MIFLIWLASVIMTMPEIVLIEIAPLGVYSFLVRIW